MHHAPSVIYPVGRCRFEGAVLILILLTGLATWASWALQPHSAQWHGMALSLLIWGAAGGHALRQWLRAPSGVLGWNGQAWAWPSVVDERGTAVPLVMLDLQFVMLVRLGVSGPWLWLERWREPHRWSDIRRAVYSRAIHAAPRQPHSQNRDDAAS